MNTSATGGYLAPIGTPPLDDDDLDDLVQDLIKGVTGLGGASVRPRWQPTVPKQPEPSIDWCAFGITTTEPNDSPAIEHDPDGQGSDSYSRHQDISVLCSFFGPHAKGYAQRLSDGLAIPQNIEEIAAQGMKFIEASQILSVPDQVNLQWIRRYDLTMRLRRKVTRIYPVLNLLSADVSSTTDGGMPVTTTTNITD